MSTGVPNRTVLKVSGMSCGHCEGRVVKGVSAIPGVSWVSASAANSRAIIDHDGSPTAATLIAAVEAAGYEAESAPEMQSADPDSGDPSLPEPSAAASGAADSVPLADVDPSADVDARKLQATVRLRLGGMSCAACVRSIEGVLTSLPGVGGASVDLLLERAQVQFDPRQTHPSELIAAVTALGYSASIYTQTLAAPEEIADDSRRALAAVAWSLAVGAVTMVLTMPLMTDHGGTESGDPLTAAMTKLDASLQSVWPSLYQLDADLLRWTLLVLCTSVVVGPARGFFLRAWSALRHRSADMNTLVALGTGSAWLLSALATVAPHALHQAGLPAHVWFDAVPWVPGLVLLGRFLEDRAKRKTRQGLDALVRLQPAQVLRWDGTEPREVPVREILPGDRILVRAGTAIGCDGVIEQGQAAIDESLITGESMPVLRGPGQAVVGGAIATDGELTVRVTKIGEDAALATIIAQVEAAQAAKPELQRLADRVAAVFAPVVVAVASLAGLAWFAFGPEPRLGHALLVAVTVVIVACPCAMGLAVPTAVMVAIGRAARLGLLIRTGAALENGHAIGAVVFDKTGTLTLGKPKVQQLFSAGDALDPPLSPQQLWSRAAALEQTSSHPLAKALVDHIRGEKSWNLPAIDQVGHLAGRGISATLNGQAWLIGAPEWLGQSGADLQLIQGDIDRAAGQSSLLAVAIDGRAVGLATLADELRPSAREAVQRLQRLGLEVALISGDRPPAVQHVAEQLGIRQWHGAALPQHKVDLVNSLRAQGIQVAVVGDGVNDAPALAAADLAVAMGTGTDVAAAQADVAIMGQDLGAVVDLLLLARATRSILKQNLAWAFGYNLLAIPVAAGALVPLTGIWPSPVLASAAMALSSVSVVANSLRLRGWRARSS